MQRLGKCLTAGLSSGSSHGSSQAEPSTRLCRLRGCPLESMFSNHVIVQYLKGKSQNPMKVGTPPGPGEVDCLATSTCCCSVISFCCKYISRQVCLVFFSPFKMQTNESYSKTWRCLVTECILMPMGWCPKSRLQSCITFMHYHIKRQIFCQVLLTMYIWILVPLVHWMWFYVS